MTNKTDLSKPVYPLSRGANKPNYGMSLREHFAGLAMQSCWHELTDCNRPQHYGYAAKSCVAMADALIAELSKEQAND